MTRARLAALLTLWACGDTEKDTPSVPVDDTPEPEDTFVVDTADDDSDVRYRDSDDTASQIELIWEVRTEVTPGERWVGWEAYYFRWVHPGGEARKPRCIYLTDFQDWASDPSRYTTADPPQLRPDPLAARLPNCPECSFAFTMSSGNQREVLHLPTDPAYDPEAPLPEPNDELELSCEALRQYGLLAAPDPSAQSHMGLGFVPGEEDPDIGTLYFWDVQNLGWFPIMYDVQIEDGILGWSDRVRTYQIAY